MIVDFRTRALHEIKVSLNFTLVKTVSDLRLQPRNRNTTRTSARPLNECGPDFVSCLKMCKGVRFVGSRDCSSAHDYKLWVIPCSKFESGFSRDATAASG